MPDMFDKSTCLSMFAETIKSGGFGGKNVSLLC